AQAPGDELGERLRALEERPAPEPLFDQLRAVVARVDDLGRRVEEEAARKDSEHLHERIAELAAQVDGLPSRLGGLSSREELEGRRAERANRERRLEGGAGAEQRLREPVAELVARGTDGRGA